MGITTTESITYDNHAMKVLNNIKNQTNKIKHIKHLMSPKQTKMYFNGVVLSSINYGIQIWSNCKTDIKKNTKTNGQMCQDNDWKFTPIQKFKLFIQEG